MLAVFALLATGVGAFFAAYLHHRSDLSASAPPTPARHAIIFVLSGVPASALQTTDLPNIAALRARGVTYRSAWVGQMESLPIASAATIGTGAFPARDGVIGMQWRDPNSGSVVQPTGSTAVRQGELDQIMETASPPSLAATIAGRSGSGKTVSIGGEGCAAASAAGTWMADYVLCPVRYRRGWIPAAVTGHSPPTGVLAPRDLRTPAARGTSLAPAIEGWRAGAEDAWIASVAVRAMRLTHPRLTIVNFPEYGALSRYTPAARQNLLRFLLRGIDHDIGLIVREERRQKLDGQTVYIVTSDGGVARFARRVPLVKVKVAVRAAGGQPVYVQPGATLAIGLRDILQAQPVVQSIESASLRGVASIFYKSGTRGAYRYAPQYLSPSLPSSYPAAAQYLLTTMASPMSPDAIVAFSHGSGIPGLPVGRHVDIASSFGMGWAEQHIPLIVAGHGILPGRVLSSPARLVDIAPTVAALMGSDLTGSNGVVLEDAFLHQVAGPLARERRADQRLRAYVRALSSAG